MQVLKGDIDFKFDYGGVDGIASDIFPPNFTCCIIGKPGSGKTTLLRSLLLNPNLLFRKFEYVFIASPSLEEYPFVMNPTAITDKFDINWFFNILSKIQEEVHVNILIVIDDFISQIKKEERNPLLGALFYNRRHIVKNGTISIIITSQRYMSIPSVIRSVLNILIIFTLINKDIKKIYEEHISIPKKTWTTLTNFADKETFLICNFQEQKFFLKFDQVVFSR